MSCSTRKSSNTHISQKRIQPRNFPKGPQFIHSLDHTGMLRGNLLLVFRIICNSKPRNRDKEQHYIRHLFSIRTYEDITCLLIYCQVAVQHEIYAETDEDPSHWTFSFLAKTMKFLNILVTPHNSSHYLTFP